MSLWTFLGPTSNPSSSFTGTSQRKPEGPVARSRASCPPLLTTIVLTTSRSGTLYTLYRSSGYALPLLVDSHLIPVCASYHVMSYLVQYMHASNRAYSHIAPRKRGHIGLPLRIFRGTSCLFCLDANLCIIYILYMLYITHVQQASRAHDNHEKSHGAPHKVTPKNQPINN